MSILVPLQNNCVDTRSLTEKWCWYSLTDRKHVPVPVPTSLQKKAPSSNCLISAKADSVPSVLLKIKNLLMLLFSYSNNVVGIYNKFCLLKSSFFNFIIVLS